MLILSDKSSNDCAILTDKFSSQNGVGLYALSLFLFVIADRSCSFCMFKLSWCVVCAAKAKGQRTKAFLHVLKYSAGGVLEVNTSDLFFLKHFPSVQTLILELVTSLWVIKMKKTWSFDFIMLKIEQRNLTWELLYSTFIVCVMKLRSYMKLVRSIYTY